MEPLTWNETAPIIYITLIAFIFLLALYELRKPKYLRMNKFLLLLPALFAFGFSARAQQVIYHMRGYDSYYNPKTKIADSVIYTAQPHQKKAGRLSAFHGNYVADYKHSHYDLGHMANAEDMNYSDTSEYDSFNSINVFPQLPECNRVTWLALENYVRSLQRPVRVKISWQGIAGYIGKDSVTVPAVCIKELSYSAGGSTVRERYVVPNAVTVKQHPFAFYKRPGT